MARKLPVFRKAPPASGLDYLRNPSQEEFLTYSDEAATDQDLTCPPDWFFPEECGLPIFPEDTTDRGLEGLEDIIETDLDPEEYLHSITDPLQRADMAGRLAAQEYMTEKYQPTKQYDLAWEFTLAKLFPHEIRPICLPSFTMVFSLADLTDLETDPDELLVGFDFDNGMPEGIVCEVSLPS